MLIVPRLKEEPSSRHRNRRTKVKKLTFGLTFLCIFAFVITPSFADLTTMDNWTLKVGGNYIDGIDFMNYTGIAHVDTEDKYKPSGISENDPFTDTYVFKISPGDFENDSTGTITNYRGGGGISVGDFELTGIASLPGHHTSVMGDDVDYVFDSATINLYLDTNPGTFAQPGKYGGTIGGYTDGTLIATFSLYYGSGNFDLGDRDGNIDVTFISDGITPEHMFAEDGTDLADLVSVWMLTDSNSQSKEGLLPTNWTEYTGQTVGVDEFDLQLEVDGSTRNAVPIPGSVLLFGSGLLGLIGLGRRKFTSKED